MQQMSLYNMLAPTGDDSLQCVLVKQPSTIVLQAQHPLHWVRDLMLRTLQITLYSVGILYYKQIIYLE